MIGASQIISPIATLSTLLPNPSSLRDIRAKLQARVKKMTASVRRFRPGLAIVQVGDRLDSNVYIRMKLKAAEEIGIEAHHLQVPTTITERELLFKVSQKTGMMMMVYGDAISSAKINGSVHSTNSSHLPLPRHRSTS